MCGSARPTSGRFGLGRVLLVGQIFLLRPVETRGGPVETRVPHVTPVVARQGGGLGDSMFRGQFLGAKRFRRFTWTMKASGSAKSPTHLLDRVVTKA